MSRHHLDQERRKALTLPSLLNELRAAQNSAREAELLRYIRNIRNPPRPRDLDPEYVRHYNRGWKASNSAGVAVLDAADRRGEPDAWYDGYSDHGCERPKWTRVPDSAWKEKP